MEFLIVTAEKNLKSCIFFFLLNTEAVEIQLSKMSYWLHTLILRI
jgi:hypothetical protein